VNDGVTPTDPVATLVDTTEGSVAVTREGAASLPAILCIHGIPGSARDFRYLAPHLTTAFHVLRVEMPGFGGSPPSAVTSVRAVAKLLVAVADACSLERFFLLGHSFGGGPVIHAAALAHERVAGVALLASIGRRRHRAFGPLRPRAFRFTARLAGMPVGRTLVTLAARLGYSMIGLRPPERGDWRTVQRQLSIVGSIDFAEIRRLTSQLEIPALVAHAEDDPLVQIAIARELAGSLPHGEGLFFPTGGHFVQKTQAAAIGRAICARFTLQAAER
jgi:pimeloyl-ACP methyl ester carboxylesterase